LAADPHLKISFGLFWIDTNGEIHPGKTTLSDRYIEYNWIHDAQSFAK